MKARIVVHAYTAGETHALLGPHVVLRESLGSIQRLLLELRVEYVSGPADGTRFSLGMNRYLDGVKGIEMSDAIRTRSLLSLDKQVDVTPDGEHEEVSSMKARLRAAIPGLYELTELAGGDLMTRRRELARATAIVLERRCQHVMPGESCEQMYAIEVRDSGPDTLTLHAGHLVVDGPRLHTLSSIHLIPLPQGEGGFVSRVNALNNVGPIELPPPREE